PLDYPHFEEKFMEWTYTLADAIQLIIPWACMLLLSVVLLAYSVLYSHFREPSYLSGLFISLAAFIYVFCEAMVVVLGWTDYYFIAPYFHRIGQLTSLWFTPALMYFALTSWKLNTFLNKIISLLGYLALGVAGIVTLTAFILPDSFISSMVDHTRVVLSPGDFGRGTLGSLYGFRDIFFGSYIVFFSIIAISRLIRGPRDSKLVFVLSGLLFVVWGALDDMLFYQIGRNFFFNSIRFSRVSVGLTLMVFLFLTALLNEFLKTQHELEETYSQLKKSEEKYKILSEGTDQAIFSLSRDLMFDSYNQQAEQLFSLFHHHNKPLGEILRLQTPESSHILADTLEEKIQSIKDNAQTSFQSIVKDPRTGEPQEYQFQFNPIPGDRGEYIGRASAMVASRLSGYVEYEKLKLNIDNYILVIDDVSTRLTHALPRYFDAAEVMHIKMGLQEMIINAIEHGNLGINFEEKSMALEKGNYRELIRQRQNLSPYKEKMVNIEYILTSTHVKYLITDQGEGFDCNHTLTHLKKKVDDEMLPHGRGIAMTQIIFDKVTYNKKGNKVLLEKNLH
nr:ATP-binding protein [Spirochaetaceae bacterium]